MSQFPARHRSRHRRYSPFPTRCSTAFSMSAASLKLTAAPLSASGAVPRTFSLPPRKGCSLPPVKWRTRRTISAAFSETRTSRSQTYPTARAIRTRCPPRPSSPCLKAATGSFARTHLPLITPVLPSSKTPLPPPLTRSLDSSGSSPRRGSTPPRCPPRSTGQRFRRACT